MFRFISRLFRLLFVLMAAGALVCAALGYGLYRLFGGKAVVHKRLRAARARTRQAQQDAWVQLKDVRGNTCPHCNAALDPQRADALCPECYGDLQQTCPGCGEAVPIRRRICPHCQAQLPREAQ